MTSTGVPALDKLLSGGYPEKSAILIEGLSSNEKEKLGYEFIRSGLNLGESCVYVSRLSQSDVVSDARALEVDIDRGAIWMCPEGGDRSFAPEDLASISFGIKGALKEFAGRKVRVVFDLSSQLLISNSSDSVYRFLNQLLADLKRYDAVFVATVQEDMHQPQVLAGLELLFDGVLAVRRSGESEVEVRVKKMRGIRPTASSALISLGVMPPKPSAKRIAVLPFANMSPDPNDEYFADGMTEELIATMSKLGGLKVIARTSVMGYKRGKKKISEIARELDVATILEGSVRKAGDKLRITVQLIDSQTGDHLWADNYDRELKDVFAIQAEISKTVAGALEVQLLMSERKMLEKRPTISTEAHALFMQGVYHNLNGSTGADMRKSIDYLERAVTQDPTYAPAYAWMSDGYSSLVLFRSMPMEEGATKAEKAAMKALELDPDLAEAHTSLCLIKCLKLDWREAEAEAKRALELNPNIAFGHYYYSVVLQLLGRLDEALVEARSALELDPLSRWNNLQGMAGVFYFRREYGKAIDHLKKFRELDPGFAPIGRRLGWCYLQESRFEEAEDEFRNSLDSSESRPDLPLMLSSTSLADLACLYARSGRRAEAVKILDALKEVSKSKFVSPTDMVKVHAALGATDEAIRLLERAYDEGDYVSMWELKGDPAYDPLRSDFRFVELLKRVGFAR